MSAVSAGAVAVDWGKLVMYDVLVVGGGPAGASAAWQAASKGLSVLVCDRADFPRDKPCGDGITPNAVRLIDEMGLGNELKRYHAVDRFRLVADSGVFEGRWPDRVGVPNHGYVVARTELDTLLIEHAAAAGAELWQHAEGRAPIVEDGVVRGAVIRRGGTETEVRARLTIAADGMSSRIGRAVGLKPRKSAPFGIATRAQIESRRPDDPALEAYFTLRDGDKLLPGYGWVFPMGNGVLNVGVGYLSTYKHWKRLNINSIMGQFLDQLPREWELPPVATLIASDALSGWRLPMGLSVWPPARPGLMAAGDAAGAIKPFTGVGISKAIESGTVAGRTAATILDSATPADTSPYVDQLRQRWGAYYRLGRGFTTVMGNPTVLGTTVNAAMRVSGLASFLTTMMTGNGEFGGRSVADRALRGVLKVAGKVPENAKEDPADASRDRRIPARTRG